jgi:hypothetical protein
LAKEPSNNFSVRSIADFYRPIRKKCYSLLFTKEIYDYNNINSLIDKLNKLDINQLEVKEYFLDYDDEINCCEVPVIPLKMCVNIQNLWLKGNPKEKLNIFVDIIDCSEVEDELINLIDHRILIPLLVLRYIIRNSEKSITVQDLSIFALTFLNGLYMESLPCDLLKNEPNMREKRAIYLMELFLKGMENFYFANCVCGKAFNDIYFCLANYFQGTAFQVYYFQITRNQEEAKVIIQINL